MGNLTLGTMTSVYLTSPFQSNFWNHTLKTRHLQQSYALSRLTKETKSNLQAVQARLRGNFQTITTKKIEKMEKTEEIRVFHSSGYEIVENSTKQCPLGMSVTDTVSVEPFFPPKEERRSGGHGLRHNPRIFKKHEPETPRPVGPNFDTLECKPPVMCPPPPAEWIHYRPETTNGTYGMWSRQGPGARDYTLAGDPPLNYTARRNLINYGPSTNFTLAKDNNSAYGVYKEYGGKPGLVTGRHFVEKPTYGR